MIKTALISFFIGYLIILWGIRYLVRLKLGQTIRAEGPASHIKKSGTPTMGGIFIVTAVVAGVFLSRPPLDTNTLIAVSSMIGFGTVGFIDDFLKIKRGRNLGLRSWQKMLGILLLALPILGYSIGVHGYENIHPLLKALHFNNPLMFFLLGFFVIAGTTNAVNLTDGLDGLASGTGAIAFIAMAFISFNYGFHSMAYFCVVVAATLVAFLWFNHNPAKVFMGDVGSLAIGGTLGTVALLTHTELNLLVIGGLFAAEALSVIIQVTSFKLTGKRVFRMSPVHHHFELTGWPETKVVVRFWIVAALLALAGVLI